MWLLSNPMVLLYPSQAKASPKNTPAAIISFIDKKRRPVILKNTLPLMRRIFGRGELAPVGDGKETGGFR